MLFHPNDFENSPEALDIYADIEDMTGVAQAAPELYAHYLLTLQERAFDSLLDIGCGNGEFLASIAGAFPESRLVGVDLSPAMVERAKEKGVDARVADICEMEEKFSVLTAIFDVLNYITPRRLAEFLSCAGERMQEGALFLCDINTIYGFEVVANGAMTAEDEDRFLAIDSYYDDGIYRADFTLFESAGGGLYRKRSGVIHQFYHSPESIARAGGLRLLSSTDIRLYAEEPDKQFLVFEKL
jgi:predicted TPR repeat methyltransferase